MRLAQWKLIFALLPLLGAALWLRLSKKRLGTGLKFNLRFRPGLKISRFLMRFPHVLRILLLCLIAAALLRPQKVNTSRTFSSEGINIMLMLDVSGSMEARDFSPNRFEAARKVLRDFINSRKNDRIGLVVFSGEAYTACPVTTDYDMLISFLSSVKMGQITDGTAIGDGLGVAISHLQHAPGKSKIVILLTDGENNAGSITPALAASWAEDDGIKVYTIGAGSREGARIPVRDQFGRTVGYSITKLDENLLSEIADTTGARFYLATDARKLAEIYREIDRLEKTEVKTNVFYNYDELFPWFVYAALLLFMLLFVFEDFMLRVP